MGKVPWYMDDVKTTEGVEFVALKRNDSGFNRFVLGRSSMSLRDYMFIDEMRKLRNNTRFHQLTKEEVSIFSEKQPLAYLQRKQKAWAKMCGDDI